MNDEWGIPIIKMCLLAVIECAVHLVGYIQWKDNRSDVYFLLFFNQMYPAWPPLIFSF